MRVEHNLHEFPRLLFMRNVDQRRAGGMRRAYCLFVERWNFNVYTVHSADGLCGESGTGSMQ